MSLMFLLLFIILHANFSDGDEPYDKAIKIRTKRAEGTTQVTLITPALNTNVEVQKVEEKNYQKRFEREVNESNDDLEDDKVEYSDEKSIDSDYKGSPFSQFAFLLLLLALFYTCIRFKQFHRLKFCFSKKRNQKHSKLNI